VRDGGPVLALILTSAAMMGTPGPATISLTGAGAAFGIRRSLSYLAGIIAGTVAVLGAVATGITAVLLGVPGLRPVLIGVSAAYILWLAYHLATATPQSAQTQDADAPSLAGGALLGLANPKAWVAITAVFASARLAHAASADAVAKALVLTGMIVLINTGWLVVGASFAPLLRHPRRARIVNCILAGVLVAATAFAIAG
jgi:threonine/homoserine/homoserine lactone efflux protein